MCGIVGYIGKRKVLPILIDGLKKLEYRGYDSAGVAYFKDNDIKIIKEVGRIKTLENKLDSNDDGFVGIGHTRWATHGGVNLVNSHPHNVGDVIIVHNGIIENYLEIKNFLIGEGYNFYGDTDTEVAACYINYLYNNSKIKNVVDILNDCIKKFIGSYAIAVMFKSINDRLFVLKKDSPLVILRGENEFFVASDVMAYSNFANDYIVLEDLEIGVISCDDVSIYKDSKIISPKICNVEKDCSDNDLGNFKHYMIKEIHEESFLIKKWNDMYLNNIDSLYDLSCYDKIHIVGCGTAYHSGLVGKYLIEKYSDIEVNVFIASEYRYQKLFVNNNTLVIFVSQSGETADTLACVKRVKELGIKTFGIVNVKNSSIANLVDVVIYTNAGIEVSVASTKAYVSQIYIFSLLAVRLGIKNKLLDKSIFDEYRKLPKLINKMIYKNYKKISYDLSKEKKVFYLGRMIDYALCLEGSLKLKEISYINSEAYPSGELKHGTISLIENGTYVIGIITNYDIYSKSVSNIVEVKSRGAYVILVVSEKLVSEIDKNIYDEIIIINEINEVVRPILTVIPLQLIAYYTARYKGLDIDKPRNLAKSVTVE